ncbi:MAG: cysteine hydrolase [Methanomassiliicoccaceae archaeon]|nr:cysteine hydrolase [Methanomassiliicoccaceae archaeon]
MSESMPAKKDRRIALVVVDVQRKFTGGAVPETGNRDIIETINRAASMFRSDGRTVIFILYDGPCHDCMYDKEDGDEYLHGIVSDPNDIIVRKKHMNSFRNTDLADVVRECGCDSVLLAGMLTQCCVLGTYYGAFDHDLSPYLLAGGTISTDERYNEAASVLCETFTLEEVGENLRTTKMPKPARACRAGRAEPAG